MVLKNILDKCKQGNMLSDEEIGFLLTRTEEAELEQIFEVARYKRTQVFGNHVFLYSFVYFSTYCKNNCSFCFFRKDNEEPPRYRKTLEEVVKTAVELKESGVHLVDLTTGDDPYFTMHPERLAEIIREVKAATGLPVMVSPGVLDQEGIDRIAEAGADWYALYQETHNEELFAKLRLGQSYQERMDSKLYAKKKGLLIEEGLLVGIGDSIEDRIHSFHCMKQMKASQVRAMTFVEQKGAPIEGEHLEDCNRELITIAVMRILFPDCLIPASLDVEGLAGLKTRLMAGANVVTSIIPPRKGYAGVAKSEQDIDEGYRTVQGIQSTLRECKVSAYSPQDYQRWIEERKRLLWE